MMNLQALMSMMQNPMAIVSQRFSVPQGMNNPGDIISHLVQTGQVKQQDIDALRSNPMLQQFFNGK